MNTEETNADVLLVEDSLEDAELICRAMRKAGLGSRQHIARDGAEALEFLFPADSSGCSPPRLRLVLLDLKLPKVSGLEVLQRLKQNEHTRHFPVVVLTSSLEHVDVARCYALGVNSYLVKSMDPDHFSRTVQSAAKYWLQLNHALF